MTTEHSAGHFSEHFSDDRAQELALGSPNREAAAHLAACAECRALVSDYRTLGLSLAALRSPAPPPGFALGVQLRLDSRRRAESLLALWGVLVLAPATLVSLGMLWWAARSVGDGASLLSGTAALCRALASVFPALAPLQAWLSLGCAALCVPLGFALYRLLPASAGPSLSQPSQRNPS